MFTFQVANEQDDEDLRKLIASSVMPGDLAVTFEREPNFFLGCSTLGSFCEILTARSQPDGELAGILSRAGGRRYINGRAEDIGYIGQIRIANKFQGLRLLARGFPFFQKIHRDGRFKGYFGVIADENRIARGVFVERRNRNFPRARKISRICTAGILLRREKGIPSHSLNIEHGSDDNLEEVVNFLKLNGSKKQFFPVYELNDFNDNRLLRGFRLEDLFIARRNGKIAGVIGLWDQSSCKQILIRSYSGFMRAVRPVYNTLAPIFGAGVISSPGEMLNLVYAAIICIEDDNTEVFNVLFRHAYNTAASRGYLTLMVGLSERDPLLKIARSFLHIPYYSSLYFASWDDDGEFMDSIDDRIAYVEIAAL